MSDHTKHSTEPHSNERWLDGMAVIFSGTCMVHCLVLPLLVTVFPIAQGGLLDEQQFHLVMLLFILPTSLIALNIGCRKHKDLLTLVLGTLGLSLLTFTALLGHDVFGDQIERLMTTIGGLILATAHIQNFRRCRAVDCQHD